MNVKKMFASVAGVLMLAQVVAPMVTGAATYSDELQGAYEYAYAQGITTMGSIDNANMYGDLTRGQLSKMISQWAEKEMGVKADETAVCSFTDTDTAEGDLGTYVVKACQMGLMGQGIEKFRPNDKVTRGEFGTVLSRAIWGDKYDGENPFYAKHLQALKDAGIMNNIADANATEMRGWVMLMLQRAAENVNPSECNDPAVLLACSLGSDSCPAACQKDNKGDEEETASQGSIDGLPIAGDLSIAVADYSSEIKSIPAKGTVVFNAVDFKASEKVTIESVKLERTGLSDKSAIKWVWFEKDGVAVSARATLTSDGTATTRFYNNYSVNGTETLDLVVELSGAAGSEVAFNIVSATSTAKNVSANTKTSTYRTTNYKVATIDFKYNGAKSTAGTTYKLGEKTSYEIGRFQISNDTKGTEDKDIILKSLKLKNNEAIDMAATFKNVIVTRDSKTVSSKVELSSKDMVIYFNDDVLASGKRGIYTIFAEVANLERPGEAVQLYLNKTSELVANEATSNFRVAYADAMNDSDNLMSQKYIFNGGKVTFTTASNFPKTVEAAASSTDVEIAKGTLTVAEPIKLEGLKVTALLKNKSTTTAGKFIDPIKTLKVEIGWSTYTAKDATYSEGATVGDKDVATWEFSDEMYVSRTSDIRVLVSINPDAVAEDKVEFNNINGVSFTKLTYENSDKSYTISKTVNNDQIAGIIQLSNVTPTPGKFFITNKATSTQKVVVGNSEPVVIFDGEISTNKEKVSVNDLILAGAFKFTAATAGTCSAGDATKKSDCLANNYTYAKKDPLNTSTCLKSDGTTTRIWDWEGKITAAVWGSLTTESAQKALCEDGNKTWTANATEGLKAGEQISLTLDVNGTPYADAVYSPSNTDVKFSNLGDVVSWTPMKIKITAQPNINTVGSITFKVSAEGTDTQGNKATASSASAVTLSITPTASITVANSKASSTVEKAWANAELVTFSSTVKNGALSLENMYVSLSNTNAALKGQTVTAEFDGKRIDGTFDATNANLISFEWLTDTLEAGKHDFTLKTDINADNGPIALTVDRVLINYAGDDVAADIATVWTKLSVSKLFGKAYPVLSLVKQDTNNNEVTIKIANPSDSDEDLTIRGISFVNGTVAVASLNDQDLGINKDTKMEADDGAEGTHKYKGFYTFADWKEITLAAGESTELRLQAYWTNEVSNTAQLKWVLVTVDNSDYQITDSYTNVAKWADLKITYKK